MSIEGLVRNVLLVACDKVFPDLAAFGTDAPYLVWNQLGGKALYYLDNSPADRRNAVIQVAAWAKTRLEANALIRAAESALCAPGGTNSLDPNSLIASALGDLMATHDPETNLYGATQRFTINPKR